MILLTGNYRPSKDRSAADMFCRNGSTTYNQEIIVSAALTLRATVRDGKEVPVLRLCRERSAFPLFSVCPVIIFVPL